VYFSVKDTGAGMDDKTKAKMLTPYFTTSKKHGGAGIGTMIMQHVAELHGGRMIVNSEPGKGTEIVFVIPSVKPIGARRARK
jgi:signal transduction histidine kinase